MNHKTIFQRLLSFLFVVLFVYGCVEDDYSLNNSFVEQNLDYKKTRLNYSDLEKKEGVLEKVKEFRIANQPKLQYRNTQQVAGFEVNTDNVLMLEKNGIHSLNFEIIEKNTEKLRNLVLNQQEDNSYIAYLLEYDLSEQERESVIKGEVVNLNGKVALVLKDESDEKITVVYELVETLNGNFETQYSLVRNGVVLAKGGCGCSDEYNGGGGSFSIYFGFFDFSVAHWVWGFGFDNFDDGYGGAGGGGYTPSLSTTPVLTLPPIDHIAELNKITDQDAGTPFRTKIDEYVGMLDVTQVEAGIIYVKETDGSYSVVEPTAIDFDHVYFDGYMPVNIAEMRIHLHHNQSNSEGDVHVHAPSPEDVVGFCDTFSLTYSNSTYNKERWTDIVVTANGLYALRGVEPQKVKTFVNAFSNPVMFEKIMEIFNKKYNRNVLKYVSDELKNNCNNGCTPKQRKQIYNSAVNQGFVNFINDINKDYKIGVGVFKGTLNTETNDYEWERISDKN